VICEKPVTMNAKDLAEVICVAEAEKRVFSVHQNRRWDKDFCIIKKAIEDNSIGKPFYIESRDKRKLVSLLKRDQLSFIVHCNSTV
jgi:scyllo-inositol 2-dehydrogenase (NADP+)